MVKWGWRKMSKYCDGGNAGGGECGGGIRSTCWMACVKNKLVGCNRASFLFSFSYHPVIFTYHISEILGYINMDIIFICSMYDD